MAPEAPSRGAAAGAWVLAAVAGAVGVAVAQPLYEVLRSAPAFFVAHQADGWDVVWLCLALSVGLPIVLALPAVVATRVHAGVGRALTATTLGLCAGALAAAVARRLELAPVIALATAAGVAALVAVLARRPAIVHAVATLAIGVVVFPALLLSSAEVRALFPEPEEEETGAEPGPAQEAPPVVLLVLDELPLLSLTDGARRIDAGRYPNFARLAETSTWYREATTVAQSTVYSVPSILAGTYPTSREPRTPTVRHYRRNLFTILGRNFAFNTWETSTHLCPQRFCAEPDEWTIARRQRLPAMLVDLTAVYAHQIAPAAWASRLPTIDEQWRDFWSAREPGGARPGTLADRASRPDAVFAWFVNAVRPNARKPQVHFAHVMLPHQPWHWLPGGQTYPVVDRHPHGLLRQQWRGSEWEVTQAQQRHLLTVGFVDRLLGELLDTLRRRALFDRSLVIVTSDHGATFDVGAPRRNLHQEPVDTIVNVPLFVKLPGQTTGSIDDRNAELIDVLPTILQILEVKRPKGIDGMSLLAPPEAKGVGKRTYRTGNADGSGGRPILYEVGATTGRVEAAAALVRRFGTGSWAPVFALGPRPELHGRRAPTPSTNPHATARIAGLARLAAVDPRADVLPVQVAGRLQEAPGADRLELAVALNGRIHCTTETYLSEEGEEAFTALLPPAALRRGANELEIFEVTGPPEAPRLAPLRLVADEGDDT